MRICFPFAAACVIALSIGFGWTIAVPGPFGWSCAHDARGFHDVTNDAVTIESRPARPFTSGSRDGFGLGEDDGLELGDELGECPGGMCPGLWCAAATEPAAVSATNAAATAKNLLITKTS